MSDETPMTSLPADEQVEGTATPEDALGDAGKRALAALRDENKALKARIKAMEPAADAERDASSGDSSTSEEREASPAGTDSERDAAESVEEPKPRRFEGTGSGGAQSMWGRGGDRSARQLTEYDLHGMSPKAIEHARRSGQLKDLLSGK